MIFTSNSTAAQAVVAHLTSTDEGSAPDQDLELPWCALTPPLR